MNPHRSYILAPLVLALVTAAQAEQPPARVVVSTVDERTVAQTVEMVGVIDFDRLAKVSAEVSGVIDLLQIRQGELVEKGAPLARINADFLRKDIDITQREVEQVEADIKRERRNQKRFQALMKTNVASRREYEQALYTADALSKKRDGLREQIARLELQIEKSTVRAPFNGIVLEKYRELGEWTGPETPICLVASTQDTEVKVAISEQLVRYLRPGVTVPVVVGALGLELQGMVKGFDPVADMRSKTLLLKIAIPFDSRLAQNLSATVQVPAGEEMTLRMVDRDAVVRTGGRDFVFAVEEGKAKRLPVDIRAHLAGKVGVDNDTITVGMAVVVDGNDRLRPGQSVTVLNGAE